MGAELAYMDRRPDRSVAELLAEAERGQEALAALRRINVAVVAGIMGVSASQQAERSPVAPWPQVTVNSNPVTS